MEQNVEISIVKRYFINCGVEIMECMGFVKYDDFIKMLDGKGEPTQVKERCGKCVEIFEMNKKKRSKADAN